MGKTYKDSKKYGNTFIISKEDKDAMRKAVKREIEGEAGLNRNFHRIHENKKAYKREKFRLHGEY